MKRFIRKYKKIIFIFLIFIIIWNSMKPIKEAFEDPAYKQNNDNMRHGKHNFRILPKTNQNGELNTDVGGDPSDGSKYHANLSPEQMIKNSLGMMMARGPLHDEFRLSRVVPLCPNQAAGPKGINGSR